MTLLIVISLIFILYWGWYYYNYKNKNIIYKCYHCVVGNPKNENIIYVNSGINRELYYSLCVFNKSFFHDDSVNIGPKKLVVKFFNYPPIYLNSIYALGIKKWYWSKYLVVEKRSCKPDLLSFYLEKPSDEIVREALKGKIEYIQLEDTLTGITYPVTLTKHFKVDTIRINFPDSFMKETKEACKE